MKRSKRYRNNLKKIENVKSFDEALDRLKELEPVKFDESVELHVKLNINLKKSDQQVRFSTELPHGTGKVLKVAAFLEGGDAKKAKAAGADFVFSGADILKIGDKIKIDFDVCVATPSMMPGLAKIAKILGPKGLMPSPKNETITTDIEKTLKQLRKGKINVKSDSGGCVHQMIGKLSFKKEDLADNYKVILEALEKQRPAKLKGKFVKRITVSTTMGPGIRVKGF
ncbi:MAG: 50S ribosomal protein L1 [Patescibacteria group bacterium]|nr:50S ribosomal protein L1 [Patescibacteria group bacterium]